MLRYLSLLCLVLCWNAPLYAKTISIRGTIDNAQENSLSFSLQTNALSQEAQVYRIELQEDQSFALAIDIADQQWIVLQHATFTFPLFVARQQEEIQLHFDALAPQVSLRFQGPAAIHNTFLANFYRLFVNHQKPPYLYESGALVTQIDADLAQKAQRYAVYDYFKYLESQFKAQQQYLHRQTNISPRLFQYMDKYLGWRYEVHKIAYFLLHKDRLSRDDLRLYWARYSLLRYTNIHDDTAVDYPEYQNLLTAFIHYLDLESPGEESSKDLAFYRFVNGNLSGKSGFFMMAKLILDNYQRASNPRLAHRRFKRFQKDNLYPEYTLTLESLLGADLEYVPQKVVGNFKTLDTDGIPIYLSDYTGQVVYISFWASWCGPCLENFRKTRETRKQLSRSGIAVLNVNLDDNETIWKKTLEREAIAGINVFAADGAELKAQFNFKALPHYILVNKRGLQSYLSTEDLNIALEEFYELNAE